MGGSPEEMSVSGQRTWELPKARTTWGCRNLPLCVTAGWGLSLLGRASHVSQGPAGLSWAQVLARGREGAQGYLRAWRRGACYGWKKRPCPAPHPLCITFSPAFLAAWTVVFLWRPPGRGAVVPGALGWAQGESPKALISTPPMAHGLGFAGQARWSAIGEGGQRWRAASIAQAPCHPPCGRKAGS